MRFFLIFLVFSFFISTLLCTLLVPLVINGVSYFVIFSKESKKQSQSNHNEEVEYFPWNDGLNYTTFCRNLISILNSNSGPAIIHNGIAGGLTHKFQLLLQDITLALVMKRKLYCIILLNVIIVVRMLDTFWNNHDSCLKKLKYNESIACIILIHN